MTDNAAASWGSAPKSNGIFLLDYLTKNRFRAELISHYHEEKERFGRLLDQSPKAVVISTTFIHHKQVLRDLVEDIRRQAPDIYVVVGGPFVFSSFMLLQRINEKGYEHRIRQRTVPLSGSGP